VSEDLTAGPSAGASRPRISVVLPTFQRRELVTNAVRALARQVFDQPFEVVVTVDGSTDGTAKGLRGLDVRFPLIVIEQVNAGAAAARNVGAHRARGEIVLFLDDDMEADPRLLAQHERLHREGADAVLGHMPLHPETVRTAISDAVAEWSDERLSRLSQPGAVLTLHDLLTGQLSVSAAVFRQLSGFDRSFTQGGSFGNEDVDFGHRLLRGGFDIRFNPDAISWQRYSVTARQHLRQWRQAGQADVLFARKHPDEVLSLFELNGLRNRFAVRVARPLSRAPLWGPLTWPVRALGARVGDRTGRFSWYVFLRARMLEYWRGVSEGGGIPDRNARLRVLAYHALSGLADRGALEPYGVPLEQLRHQLSALRSHGYHPISAAEFTAFADGRAGLPRRAVLFTFDDCYLDLLAGAELLHTEGAGALAFAVSGLVGRENEWDRHHGGPPLPLLDAGDLRRLRDYGVEVGAHSRTHAELPTLSQGDIETEVRGSVTNLEALGLGPVRFFAYPYGEHDERVLAAVRSTGLTCAFAIDTGVMDQRTDPLRIPRIEILRQDTGARFIAKVLFARQLGWAVLLSRRISRAGHRISGGGRCGLRRALRRLPGPARSSPGAGPPIPGAAQPPERAVPDSAHAPD
jgi:glycosyltransferase involved in cell wall biosynthesis/peptidoglycan/xylan/chitin deacetylase (PgdA/CDA1 family)